MCRVYFCPQCFSTDVLRLDIGRGAKARKCVLIVQQNMQSAVLNRLLVIKLVHLASNFPDGSRMINKSNVRVSGYATDAARLRRERVAEGRGERSLEAFGTSSGCMLTSQMRSDDTSVCGLNGRHDSGIGVLSCGAAAKNKFTDFVNPRAASQSAATNVEIAIKRATSLENTIVMGFLHVVGGVPNVVVLAAAGGT